MSKVGFKKGLYESLPETGDDGVFYLTTDTHQLFVGDENNQKHEVGKIFDHLQSRLGEIDICNDGDRAPSIKVGSSYFNNYGAAICGHVTFIDPTLTHDHDAALMETSMGHTYPSIGATQVTSGNTGLILMGDTLIHGNLYVNNSSCLYVKTIECTHNESESEITVNANIACPYHNVECNSLGTLSIYCGSINGISDNNYTISFSNDIQLDSGLALKNTNRSIELYGSTDQPHLKVDSTYIVDNKLFVPDGITFANLGDNPVAETLNNIEPDIEVKDDVLWLNRNVRIAESLHITASISANELSGNGSGLTNLDASQVSNGTLTAERLPASGATAGLYGPIANVTGTNNTTISVPSITVDTYGRITDISNKTYTSKNTEYTYAEPYTLGLVYDCIYNPPTDDNDCKIPIHVESGGYMYAYTPSFALGRIGFTATTRKGSNINGYIQYITRNTNFWIDPATQTTQKDRIDYAIEHYDEIEPIRLVILDTDYNIESEYLAQKFPNSGGWLDTGHFGYHLYKCAGVGHIADSVHEYVDITDCRTYRIGFMTSAVNKSYGWHLQ